jgi:hypothetical protein
MRQLTVAMVASMLAKEIEQFAQFYIGDTSSSAQPGQTIQVGNVIALCWQPILSGSALVVNTGSERIAFSPKITTQTNNRIIQNVRRKRRVKQETIEPSYGIFYLVDKESTSEFWLASEAYETQLHTLDKLLTVIPPDAPPSYYLAVWGEIKYNYEGSSIFEEMINVDFTTGIPADRLILGQSIDYPDYSALGFYQQFFVFGFPQSPILTALIPKPSGLVKNFTGRYRSQRAEIIHNIFSNEPILYDYENPEDTNRIIYDIPESLIPSDAVLRSTLEFNFGFPLNTSNEGSNTGGGTLFEYTGYNLSSNQSFNDWIIPSAITEKGFTKNDLLVVTDYGLGARIFVKANVNPANFSTYEASHLTFGWIPWGQDTGLAWPKANRIAFTFRSGIPQLFNSRHFQQVWRSNISDRIDFNPPSGAIGDAPFYYLKTPDDSPDLLLDGRTLQEDPDEPQKIFVTQSYQTYISSTNSRNAAFYIAFNNKSDNPFVTNLTDNQSINFQDTLYSHILPDGTVVDRGGVGIVDITELNSAREDPTSSPVFSLIRYGFKDWKGYLSNRSRLFFEVMSPIGSTQNNLQFSLNFYGRHKLAAEVVNSRGQYINDNLYIVFPVSEIEQFLMNEDNEAEATSNFTFTIKPYEMIVKEGAVSSSSAQNDSLISYSRRWDDYEISEGDETESTIEIIKPIEFTRFLKDAANEANGIKGVRIIDIVPLVDG